jgi:hypothetical protein
MTRVKEERNILRTVKRRKANLIGYILRRNCLFKHVIEGMIKGRREVAGRRKRRHKQLLTRLKKTGYCKFKEKAQDRNPPGKVYGSGISRLRNDWMN